MPAREDDSHTNFSLDSLGNRLWGRWIQGPGGRIILSLNIHSMTFEWFDENQNLLNEVQVTDRSMEQLLLEVAVYPDSHSMDKEQIFSPLHFEIPDYGIKSLCIEDVSASGLDSWLKYRDLANISCQDMLIHLQAESEIRIWPHHFDTGIYAGATKDLGLGFGLAMKDSMVGSPYFYLAGFGEGVNVSGPGLPGLSVGRWETGGPWKGVVLPLDRLPEKNKLLCRILKVRYVRWIIIVRIRAGHWVKEVLKMAFYDVPGTNGTTIPVQVRHRALMMELIPIPLKKERMEYMSE